jgi:hypothetical protein
VDNTTIARNGATGDPIAIYNSGSLRLTNGTLAGNTTAVIPSPNHFYLGSAPGATTLVQNTLFAHFADDPSQDCDGVITSLGNNIFSRLAGCAITLQQSDLVGEAGLDLFTGDGTPGNEHYRLLPESPAINGANSDACGRTDQIGQLRRWHCDIGAIEFKLPPIGPTTTVPETLKD